jgi:hypothetical protein
MQAINELRITLRRGAQEASVTQGLTDDKVYGPDADRRLTHEFRAAMKTLRNKAYPGWKEHRKRIPYEGEGIAALETPRWLCDHRICR